MQNRSWRAELTIGEAALAADSLMSFRSVKDLDAGYT